MSPFGFYRNGVLFQVRELMHFGVPRYLKPRERPWFRRAT